MTPLPILGPVPEVRAAGAAEGEEALLGRLRDLGSLLVAFSGGVDSTYLAWAARRALGERALAVTAFSDSMAESARAESLRLASAIGIRHEVIETRETADPRYLANAPDRCYWCKSELFDVLERLRAERGLAAVADGTNRDDLGDVRPGRRAAAERRVLSPLVEAGLGKGEVRWLSRRAGLPTWDRPASPCLSSRVPHGTPIDAAMLRAIDRAEEGVRALGLREFRVRHHGALARLEVAGEELARALDPGLAPRLAGAMRAAGFAFATIDLEPFRSGRLVRAAGDAPPAGARPAAATDRPTPPGQAPGPGPGGER